MRPRSYCVRPHPRRRRPVAVFAGHAFRNFKRASALLRRRIQRVARQALRRFLGFRAHFQDARHPFANLSSQRLLRPAVLIIADPRRIFLLQNPAACDGLHASVTTRRCTRTRTDIFAGFILRRKQRRERHEQCAKENAKHAGIGGVAPSMCRGVCLLLSFSPRGSQRPPVSFFPPPPTTPTPPNYTGLLSPHY